MKLLFDETLRHCMLRETHGQPIAKFELPKNRIAQMAARISALDAMGYMTAGIGKFRFLVKSFRGKLRSFKS